MKIVQREFKSDGKRVVAYFVYCPGCERAHRFMVVNEAVPEQVWEFDGNMESPTFSPSLLMQTSEWDGHQWVRYACHSFLKNGVWEFLSDSTHDLAGRDAPMVDFPENYRV